MAHESHDRERVAYLDDVGASQVRTLAWRDRAGDSLETVGQPQQGMADPAVSPDGQRIAVSSTESGSRDIWVHDLIRSTKTRLTFDELIGHRPVWLPSGREIAYGSPGSGILSKAADGSGEPVVLVDGGSNPDWSRDGRYLVYQQNNPETGTDILYRELPAGNDAEGTIFLGTPATERVARLSPDGRALAYVSDEAGDFDIYLRSFPEGTGKRQVSVNGGSQPRWRSDGSELFYVEGTTLMSVAVSTDQGLTLGQPRPLFTSEDLASGPSWPSYDVSADGQRFITVTGLDDSGQAVRPTIRVVLNWYEELRDRGR